MYLNARITTQHNLLLTILPTCIVVDIKPSLKTMMGRYPPGKNVQRNTIMK